MKRNPLAMVLGAVSAAAINSATVAQKSSLRLADQVKDQFEETRTRSNRVQTFRDLCHKIDHGNLPTNELEKAKELRDRLEKVLWPKATSKRADHDDIDSFLSEVEEELNKLESTPTQVEQHELPNPFEEAEKALQN
jgi:ribosomal protein L17